MIIGGLQPCSFSDYPGRTSVVIFTQGCNFRCPYCHNGSLLDREQPGRSSEENVFAFLHNRKRHLGGVVVSGGEPTIQNDLTRFLRRVKKLGFPVKLDTNGSRPSVVEHLLTDRLIDYIAMDVKAPLGKYNKICGTTVKTDCILKSIGLIATSNISHHFRTTKITSMLNLKDLDAILQLVPPGSQHIFQSFVKETTLQGVSLRDEYTRDESKIKTDR